MVRPLFSERVFIHCNRKNHNPLDYDWFQKLLFPLILLTSCYQTVCYRTVQEAYHIQSYSLINQSEPCFQSQ